MNNIIKIQLPETVSEIITKLEQNGFEAYAVGGCIRDSILLKQPKDWDITTSAKPNEIKALFKRTVDTGIEHGTVTVMSDKTGYEVTTYRIDGEYEDGRHPRQVEFTNSLSEDLKRRDFTINAMAYNDKDGLVDLFGGVNDIKDHIIRCVGSARERFDEDALRMLRAVRFSAQLDFKIDQETKTAIIEDAYKLGKISAERIRMELGKLLLSKHPEKLLPVYETGISKVVLPEFDKMMATEQENPYHIYNVGMHTIHALCNLIKNIEFTELDIKQKQILVWAVLLHDAAKPDTKVFDDNNIAHFYGHPEKGSEKAREILKRLKFDNETVESVVRLIYYHDHYYDNMRYGLTPAGIRRAVGIIGEDIIKLLFILQEADMKSHNPETAENRVRMLYKAKEIYKEVLARDECISLKTLAVKGDDLIRAGYKSGPELGKLLKLLLEHVILYPSDNEKTKLLQVINDIKDININEH